MKFDSIETKKMDRDTTIQAIDYLTKRIDFNNELNKHVRKFMKERGLDDWHKFNGYHDEATPEMKQDLIDIITKADWMEDSDKKEYVSYCAEIYGQVYSPAVNQYVRERLKRLQAHLNEIEKAAQSRTEDYGFFKVVRDLGMNRLNLIFDDIPDLEIRTLLKSSGFKWSPYLNAWTRQLTDNAEKALIRFKQAVLDEEEN